MSIKGFHILFIVASILLSLGFAFWGFYHFQDQQMLGYLTTSIASLLTGIGLVVYLWKVVQKLKKI